MRVFRIILLALVLGFGSGPFVGSASAGPLDDAKAAGLVGETPLGLIAAVSVNPSGDIAALVADINGRRLVRYGEIAAETGSTLEQVQMLVGERLIGDAAPGSFVQGANRVWVQVP